MSRSVLTLGALLVGTLGASHVEAQSWRTLDVSRQLADAAPVAVEIVYGTGMFGLRGTTSPLLYHMQLRYDAARAEPRHSYDAAGRKLRLGVQKSDVRFTGREDGESGRLQVELSRSTPLDLTLDLGAVEADLDLSGLQVARLHVESGASEAKLRFDSPNSVPLTTFDVSLGAASFRGERLANANARNIRVDAGVGNVELDFGGQWTQDIALNVEVTFGFVTLHVPTDVGVRVALKKMVASFEHEGLVERDGAWYSTNWETARRKLHVSAETVFGKLSIDKTGR